jgi:hypothetical protein
MTAISPSTSTALLRPRRIAARAKVLNISDQTAFVDRLLMGKMESEIAPMHLGIPKCPLTS